MATTMTPRGRFVTAVHEGLVPAPYLDVVNMWTWGVGHTHMAGPPDPRKMPYGIPADLDGEMKRAWEVFRKDMKKYTDDVVKALGPDLKPHELDGWVGFHFNTGGIFKTSAVAKWKAGDKEGAMRVLNQWVNGTVDGKKRRLQALVDRRADETRLIMTGDYSLAGKVLPIWRVNSRNRPIYSGPLRTYTFDQWEDWLQEQGLLGPASPPARAPAAGVGAVVGGGVVAVVTFWDRIEAWFLNLWGGLF